MSQAYYRSQTADRAGWLNVCCDDGTSIPGYDGWAGILGEPLDRLQIGITTSSPFSIFTTGNSNGGNTSINVHYSLRVLNGSWLGEITNFNETDSNGFAGLPSNQHDMLYIKVDSGTLRYRVHTIESGWLNWISKGDPNDLVNGCAGNPGEAIDGVQIYYTTPAGETLSQAYYRSQTANRSGWLNVCCDDGTSIPGYDGWAGMLGEPLDRLQIGIACANPFSTYVPRDDLGHYTEGTKVDTTPSVDIDAIINASAHDIITENPLFSAFSKAEFKAERTYGPVVAPGVDLWITTSATWTVKGNEGAYFSIKNGKISVNVDDIVGGIFPSGLVGTLDYLNFKKTVEKYAVKIKNGAIIFSVAKRKEEPGCPGTKITFQYKTETDKQEVETEVGFEMYFKQVPGGLVSYPVEDYNKLFNWGGVAEVAVVVGILGVVTIFAPGEAVIGGAAAAASVVFGMFTKVTKLIFD